MENSDQYLITRTLTKLKELTNKPDEKTSILSETIASNLKKLPELKQYINENNKDNESKIFFEIGKYLKYSRYKKGQFIKHSYDSDNFFYMIFSGNIAKIEIKYIRTYLTFKEYLVHLIKLKLLGENYIYKKCLKRNKKIFPFDENIDLLKTKDINIEYYDGLIKNIKDEIQNSSWYTDTNENNKISDFIELYNPKISNTKLSFNSKDSKYPAYIPIYIFDKILKPLSFIGQLTKPKGIKFLSSYVCLSSSCVFYIDKTEIDRYNNLYTLFQRRVSEEVITKLFEGHFLFQDTDVNFLSKNYSKYFYIKNYIKGQKLIEQNTPNEGVYFINKGIFQLKSRRTFHQLNELKFKVMQSLNTKNKKNLTQIEDSSSNKYENIYEGLNPIQIENLTKERDILFNTFQSSDVVGLSDIYDIKTGINNFSVECISEEGEVYFLPKEILTSMITNEKIMSNVRELVEKQCLVLLREINNNRKSIENNIRSITNSNRSKNINVFYLRKNKDDFPNANLHGFSRIQNSFDFSTISNYNNINTLNNTNFSNQNIINIKEKTIKNKILNTYNKTPKIAGSRILSPKLPPYNKGIYSPSISKKNEKSKHNKIKERRNEQTLNINLNSLNQFLTYKEKIKTLKILKEEKKNEISVDKKKKILGLKSEYNNILNNQNKNINLFQRKSLKSGKIKRLILKGRQNNPKSIKIIDNSQSEKKLIIKKMV